MTETDLRKELDSLKADLQALRTDMSDLVNSALDVGKSKATLARERAESELHKASDTFTETLEERPLTSLLVALGVGLVLGKLLSGKGD